jgi:hypothetical protein
MVCISRGKLAISYPIWFARLTVDELGSIHKAKDRDDITDE